MSDNIPFEIQSEIIKRLPVKSLLQFCYVSKQWKAFIDSPEFIKNYHVNLTNPQHHLLVTRNVDNFQTYTSITDNNTFPEQKFLLTAPESLSLLRDTLVLPSADGLLCYYGDVCSNVTTIIWSPAAKEPVSIEIPIPKAKRAIIWNPTVRKYVSIDTPIPKAGYIVAVGFGVCPDTSDPKLVKISADEISSMWVVEVFTLSTRVWKTVYKDVPFKSGDFHSYFQVFVNGVMYVRAYDDIDLDEGVDSNIVISFDLKTEKFGEVCLPDKLVRTPYLDLAKVGELLGLLDYYDAGGMILVCDVWTGKYGANKTFSKIYTIKVESKWLFGRVLGVRNNGEVVITVRGHEDDDNHDESSIQVYEPLSGHTIGVGIHGKIPCRFTARSYIETLLLLDESDSIIHQQQR